QLVAAVTKKANGEHRGKVWRLGASGLEEVLREQDARSVVFQQEGPLVAFGLNRLVVYDLKARRRWEAATRTTGELAIGLHPRLPLAAVSTYFAKMAEVVDLNTGREVAAVALAERGGPVAWSPDGRYLAVAEQSQTRLHEAGSYRLVRVFRHSQV